MKLLKTSLAVTLLLASTASFADVAIIVNKSNINPITEKDLDRIFLGKDKSFANGDKISAANLPSGSATREEFETKALKKSSQQVKAYWAKLIFSGKAKPLVESGSDQEAIKYVAENPDAIAYIDAANVDDTVKVVLTLK